MTSYFIFKTDRLANKTTAICGGCHDDEQLCKAHWQAYMYGFMGGASEILGIKGYQMLEGTHQLSFRFSAPDKSVEYFMLLDQEGQALMDEISK